MASHRWLPDTEIGGKYQDTAKTRRETDTDG